MATPHFASVVVFLHGYGWLYCPLASASLLGTPVQGQGAAERTGGLPPAGGRGPVLLHRASGGVSAPPPVPPNSSYLFRSAVRGPCRL